MAGLEGCQVLILDDDLDLLETLARILVLSGAADVRCAVSVAEAERQLGEGYRPTVVVLDLKLHRDRGEKLLARLRADPVLRSVPVIAVSGEHAALARVRDRVERVFLKPADPRDLLEAIRTVTGGFASDEASCKPA